MHASESSSSDFEAVILQHHHHIKLHQEQHIRKAYTNKVFSFYETLSLVSFSFNWVRYMNYESSFCDATRPPPPTL
jgi:hypothetical protein